MNKGELAIHGGPKARKKPLPYRRLFGEEVLEYLNKVFKDNWKKGVDFGYQGEYEKLYTDKFCEFQGGGFADAVSSGTAGIYLALKAFDFEPASDVIVSPVTDPGSISPIILSGMNPIIADSAVDSFNIGPEEFKKILTPKTRAAILTHVSGNPIEIEAILEIANYKGIKIIEDCSQAHGALYKGKRVGCFGNIAVFSTMYSKNHATGGCGGIVYTKDEDYYWRIRSLADRGKPFQKPDFDPKNPGEFLFPALNFNLDELSCVIGISTLSRLQETINKRNAIIKKIKGALESSSVVSSLTVPDDVVPSPFFLTVKVDVEKLKVSKKKFAEAVAAEGIWINPDYRYIVSEWSWIKKYLKANTYTPNAVAFRDRTFNILFNERFLDDDIKDIVASILKVESVFAMN